MRRIMMLLFLGTLGMAWGCSKDEASQPAPKAGAPAGDQAASAQPQTGNQQANAGQAAGQQANAGQAAGQQANGEQPNAGQAAGQQANAGQAAGQQADGEQAGAATAQVGGAAMEKAKNIFQMRCAVCHGQSGKGDGPGAASLNPKPRDYTNKQWQSSVTDEELEKIIVQGGAAVDKSPLMPPNPDLGQKPEVLDGIVAIIRGFAAE